jgi:ABC-type polysaccharide/polyol phosphate transport system ATPase subunit
MSAAMMDIALEGVWKQYRLNTRRRASTFWALQDVNLEVPRGASVGVIGRNGAGKSTLLKLLAGITAPTRGRIVLHGRVAALIEVGSGFHPELTGRENVFLSGAILGMRRREIAAKLDRIVDFAGVDRFVDTPVKWYSSGMYVRLGFAVAAHMEPDILLVDEVLAVGDAEFQVKCLQRIQELKDEGTTSLFISHDLTAVERLCDSAVLFEGGAIAATGLPSDVVASYHRRLILPEAASGEASCAWPTSGVALTNVTIHDPVEAQAVSFRTGAPLTISLRYAVARPVSDVEFELRYYSADGKTRIAAPRTGEGGEPLHLKPPGGLVEFSCPALPLKPGSYTIGAVVRDIATAKVLAWWDGETKLYVRTGPATDGQFYFPHSWQLTHAEEADPDLRSVRLQADRREVRLKPDTT